MAARPGTCNWRTLLAGSRMSTSAIRNMALRWDRAGPFCARKTAATWKRVDKNLKEWLYALAFADANRGYAVGARGIILRTDDGGATWKDLESGLSGNLFAVAVDGRDEVIVTGDQGRIIYSKDGGANWEIQPSITSVPLYSVAYRGGNNIWIAGRGGAILRRTEPVATVKIPAP